VTVDDTKLHRALGDPSRVRIVDALRASIGPLDAVELAERVRLHPNTVRSHLRILAEAGLVSARAEQRLRPGRPRLVYEALPETGAAVERDGYRLLAEILASHLAASGQDSTERAEEAGRSWGRYLVDRRLPKAVSGDDDLDSILRLLGEIGFEPRLEPAEHGHTVLMQHCPFGEVAGSYGRVVCSVHLGLMQGALVELGARLAADDLKPFVKPGICAAHLDYAGAKIS
jgi:predicted ArsR family transcriptional regulator